MTTSRGALRPPRRGRGVGPFSERSPNAWAWSVGQGLLVEAVLPELLPQGRAVYAQNGGALRLVAAGGFEHPLDVMALELLERDPARRRGEPDRSRSARVTRSFAARRRPPPASAPRRGRRRAPPRCRARGCCPATADRRAAPVRPPPPRRPRARPRPGQIPNPPRSRSRSRVMTMCFFRTSPRADPGPAACLQSFQRFQPMAQRFGRVALPWRARHAGKEMPFFFLNGRH